MSKPVRLVGGDSGSVETYTDEDGNTGLMVFTRPRSKPEIVTRPLFNEDNGFDMNVGGAQTTSTVEIIWDGNDLPNRTATVLSGTWDTTSTNHAYEGVYAVVDYTLLSGDTATVNSDTVTEGVDWTAATSNNATASSLASALSGISGVTALANGPFIFVVTTTDIQTFTSSDSTNLTASAQSVDGTSTNNGSQVAFDNGTTVDLSSTDVLSIYIWVDSWSLNGTKEVNVAFRDSLGATIGNAVDLGQYISKSNTGVWQQAVIPYEDMGVVNQTITDLLVTVNSTGGGPAPNFYLDFITLDTSSGGVEYSISPDNGTTLYINKVKFTLGDTINNTTSANIPVSGTGILGVSTLTNGILAGKSIDGGLQTSAIIKDLRDWFVYPQWTNVESYGNGTNTYITAELNFTEVGGLPISANTDDRFIVRIRDDLSGLDFFQAWITGYIEVDS